MPAKTPASSSRTCLYRSRTHSSARFSAHVLPSQRDADFLLDSLAVGCRFEPAVGGTSEALRVAVLPIREGKCLPGVFAPNGQ